MAWSGPRKQGLYAKVSIKIHLIYVIDTKFYARKEHIANPEQKVYVALSRQGPRLALSVHRILVIRRGAMAQSQSQPALRVVESSSMDKSKALDAALSQIERNFGKGSIMRLGKSDKNMDVDTVSTGSLGLDIRLRIGGAAPRRGVGELRPGIPRHDPAGA